MDHQRGYTSYVFIGGHPEERESCETGESLSEQRCQTGPIPTSSSRDTANGLKMSDGAKERMRGRESEREREPCAVHTAE